MNILLITIGTRGDVQPFVALGRGLVAAGHQVTLAAPKGFTEMIEAAGLNAAPLPVDFQELMQQPEIMAAMSSFRGKLKAYRWAGDIMNAQLDEIWKIGQDLRPDLILNHFKGALAPQLAQDLGVVSIPVMLQPGFMPTHEYPQFLIASRSLGRVGNITSHRLIQALTRFGTSVMIKRWVKQSGVRIGRRMDPTTGHNPRGTAQRVHAYSPLIVPRPDEWPETEVQTGYMFTPVEEYTPPEDLAAFLAAGEMPIYVGFGSMPGTDHARTSEALVGALERTGQRAVIATGWGGIADLDFGDRAYVLNDVPHSWLFPRVSAVVHHGGSGTTHEGLRWGRPSVICPLFADQPFFGARVAALGAGPRPIRQKHLTADNLADAITQALNPAMRARAAEIGEAMRLEDGVARVVDLVEAATGA